MSSSLVSVTIIGNLGRDPEIRSTQDGSKIATLNVATSESWKDRTTGERKEKTEWHRVVVFNDNLVGIIEKYTSKGSKIAIHDAQLQTRKWADHGGAEKCTTEVVISKFRGGIVLLGDQKTQSAGSTGSPPQASPQTQAQGNFMPPPDLDDEIPF